MIGSIVPIVEGQSEVAAVPALIRRLLHECFKRYDVPVAKPIRVKRHLVVKPGELERTAELASRSRENAAALLLILDSDDDDPVTLREGLEERLSVSSPHPSAVVPAVREYEAWLLAGKTSLRGVRGIRMDASVPQAVESIRDCKGHVQANMETGERYLPVVDQVAMTAQLDLTLAMANSDSLQSLGEALEYLLDQMIPGDDQPDPT